MFDEDGTPFDAECEQSAALMLRVPRLECKKESPLPRERAFGKETPYGAGEVVEAGGAEGAGLELGQLEGTLLVLTPTSGVTERPGRRM